MTRPHSGPLLSLRDLTVEFATRDGTVPVLDRLSLDLDAGATLGLVGESGSGKSTTALAAARLIPARGGQVEVDDRFTDKVIMPGLVEGHCHSREGSGWDETYVGFYDRTDPDRVVHPGLKSIDDVVGRLKEAERALSDPDEPVMAWGLDPLFFGGGGWSPPTSTGCRPPDRCSCCTKAATSSTPTVSSCGGPASAGTRT